MGWKSQGEVHFTKATYTDRPRRRSRTKFPCPEQREAAAAEVAREAAKRRRFDEIMKRKGRPAALGMDVDPPSPKPPLIRRF